MHRPPLPPGDIPGTQVYVKEGHRIHSSAIEPPAFLLVQQSPFSVKYVLGNDIIQGTRLRMV